MSRLSLVFLLSALIFAACQRSSKPRIAWYHWSNSLYSGELHEFNKIHGTHKLYVRLFDVKWHVQYGPYPEAGFYGSLADDSLENEIVPVVYITNESLINTHPDSIPSLYRKMKIEILSHLDKFNKNRIHEWQFDCDWTEKSREKYFRLLRLFGESESVRISATVKLWQYAYREKAGIPPCDRAVLMCYNVANPRDPKVVNSIFDAEEVKKYLKKEEYPLPLDIALPHFGWGVWFRNGEFRGLIDECDSTELNKWPVSRLKLNHYVFHREFEDSWRFFKEGDELRLEVAGPDEFIPLAKELSKHFNDPNSSLILYNFEQFNAGRYAHDSQFVDGLLRYF